MYRIAGWVRSEVDVRAALCDCNEHALSRTLAVLPAVAVFRGHVHALLTEDELQQRVLAADGDELFVVQ